MKVLSHMLLGVLLAPCCARLASAQVATPPEARTGQTTRLRSPALDFLRPYGLSNFSDHHVEALAAWLEAKAEYDAGDYAAAKGTLDALWANHPTGDVSWGSLPGQPFGINIGTPPCYYGLRMLTDATEWRVQNPGFTQALRTVRLTVVLVGESSGIEPQNLQDLLGGTGLPVQHTLDPLLLADGSRVVHESLHLFREYVVALTDGGLEVDTRILHLPNLDMPVHVQDSQGRFYAGPVDYSDVWNGVPPSHHAATDWWWLVYPSHVPEQHPDFQNAEFVTGGMGTGPVGPSPCFIIDDRWLVRKPPHIGSGPYTTIERDAYLPQWLQHEFFHHLFRTYPEFGLEDTPHQWFDLASWPQDFQGRYEADYFHEALTRRLQGATPSLTAGLRYATDGAPWSQFDVGDLIGDYQRNPVQNLWHLGSIQLGPQLEWRNAAGVEWSLQDDLQGGRLLTGPDCPYFTTGWLGTKFDVVLERDALGDLLPVLEGFSFNGDLYERVGP